MLGTVALDQRACLFKLPLTSARHISPSLVLVQPRKTRPYITERLLMGRKESNQTNKTFDQCACLFYFLLTSSPGIIGTGLADIFTIAHVDYVALDRIHV